MVRPVRRDFGGSLLAQQELLLCLCFLLLFSLLDSKNHCYINAFVYERPTKALVKPTSFMLYTSSNYVNAKKNRSKFLLLLQGSKSDNNMDNNNKSKDTTGSTNTKQDDLYKALSSRINELQQGIGKRYVCRTQKGFLNIHKEPGDPYDTSNIIGTLSDSQIVASISPKRGPWIKHDAGGWSISVHEGFIWLEELKE